MPCEILQRLEIQVFRGIPFSIIAQECVAHAPQHESVLQLPRVLACDHWEAAPLLRSKCRRGRMLTCVCEGRVMVQVMVQRNLVHRILSAVTILTWLLAGTHASRGQEGITYFYLLDPGQYVLEKLDGRGIFRISEGPKKNVLRIDVPSNTTARDVKRDLKKEFADLQFIDNVDGPQGR
jgi:hypothetical protein